MTKTVFNTTFVLIENYVEPKFCVSQQFVLTKTKLQFFKTIYYNKLGLSCAKLITNLSYLKKMLELDSNQCQPVLILWRDQGQLIIPHCDYIAKTQLSWAWQWLILTSSTSCEQTADTVWMWGVDCGSVTFIRELVGPHIDIRMKYRNLDDG